MDRLDLDGLQTAFVLIPVFALGTRIGAERQHRRRNAGLRTDVLVRFGEASRAHLGGEVNGHAGPTTATIHVASSVDFFGAGVVMRGDGEVRGAHHVGQALVVTTLVLAANPLLRLPFDIIDRAARRGHHESQLRVLAVVDNGGVTAAPDLLIETLEAAR